MIIETIAGTILGFAGTALTTYSNYKMAKIDIQDKQYQRQHELAMVAAQSDAMMKEAEASIKVSQVIAQSLVDNAEANAFVESQKSGNRQALPSQWIDILYNQQGWARYFTVPIGSILLVLLGIADALQSLMRPTLTLYSVGMATYVTYKAWDILTTRGITTLSVDQAYQTWTDATSQMILLAVTLITWWFGDRRMAKHLMHLKEG